MRPRFDRYALACTSAVVVLAAVVALNGIGSFYTDIKPEVYLAPWETLGRYASGWSSSPYLGSANFNVGLLPVLVVVGALRSIGLNPEWAFKVFHFGLWLLMAVGASRLVRLLVAPAGRWAGLVTGILYVANPYQMQAGTTLAILLPMALLPWLLIAFVRALRQPSGWVWPAIFGMVFFGMSGMNVAVVPIFQLTALLPVLLFARLDWRMALIDLVKVTAKCAGFVIGFSLYWLVPARAALSTGRQIVLQSETLDGIAKVSSFSEVLRGMGMWPIYGTDANGPWLPQSAIFLISTWAMLLTMLWPTLAMLALRWVPGLSRGAVIGWVAIASVFMVGIFPGPAAPQSPFGFLLRSILSNPAASAFRTTNKIGAVLALGFAVALGVAVEHWARAWRHRDGVFQLVLPLTIVLVAAWTLPAFTNRLYTSHMNIPGYWYQAAKAADEGDPSSRVLFLPGQVRPTYRWTPQRPDDLPNSLLKRDAIIPETSPNASPPGGNFLAALDDVLQTGGSTADSLSTYARYLGVDRILLRHDTVWEQDGGARPAQLDRQVSTDPGLFGRANFGNPGEFVFGRGTDAYSNGEGLMRPVQLYDVRDPVTALRATADNRSLVVAGDGWSVRQLAANGLLANKPSFRYAGSMSAADLRNQLGRGHVLVISDTNARRAAIPNRLTGGEGSLLEPQESASNMRSLFSADDQTVLVRSGARVSATTRGGAFFDLPYASPENMLDRDPATSWLFGDFDRATGQSATITQPTPVTLGKIRVKQAQVGAVRIDRLTVTAGGRSITQRMPDNGYAIFDFGSTNTDSVKVEVASTRGEGYNMVGISEVEMAGAPAVRAARTPITFQRLYQALSPADQQRFDATPLNVTLTRLQGTSSRFDDPETSLRRIVTLPGERTFTPSAMVRVQGDVESVYDDVAGFPKSVRATSSDFWFHNADARASMAADGKSTTAWVPGGALEGSWWQLAGARRSISQVTIDQARGFGDSNNTQWAAEATVTVDGRTVARQRLTEGGSTKISFAPTQGSTVRVTFKAGAGAEGSVPPRFTKIDTGVTMKQDQAGPLDATGSSSSRCQVVATIDGQPVRMRPADTLASASEQGTRWIGCGKVQLGAGEHRVDQAAGFTLDDLTLTDQLLRAQPRTTDPIVQITRDSSAAKSMTVNAAGPFNVILGQSYDERWVATSNGKSLGRPTLIDGYSTGWRVPEGGQHTIDIRFAPQRASYVAAGMSLAVLLIALGLIVLALRRRTLWQDEPQRVIDEQSRRRLPRWAKEIGLVAVSGFFVGVAGLAAAVVVVLVARRHLLAPRRLLMVGAGLVFLAMPVYLIAIGDKRGTVSADAVAMSLWPHHLAGAGLVIALSAALLMHRIESPSADAPGEQPGEDAS
ncbi:DUF3367 domain-containing protein [Yimella sp. cx-573]|nr:DUF3367 domain-containing protein [Yimella sp. cx-573]